jgi:hypothetical protein
MILDNNNCGTGQDSLWHHIFEASPYLTFGYQLLTAFIFPVLETW